MKLVLSGLRDLKSVMSDKRGGIKLVSRKIGITLLVSMLVNLLLFGGIQSVASESFGPEFQVNTTTNFGQRSCDIAMDPNGNFVVCWEDYDAGNYDVKFQRYSYPYTAQGGEITVASGAGHQRFPSVAMDPSGNFVVAWQDDAGGDADVHARRYDSSGNAQGGVIGVDTGGDDEDAPSVAIDTSGNFVVAWEDSGGAVGDAVQARIYDSNGNPQGGAITVANGGGDEDTAAVAMDPSGNFVVAWEDFGTNNDVKFRRYNSGGTAQGVVTIVASGLGNQDDVEVAMDSAGDFVIVYEDSTGIGGNDVRARQYSSDGTAQGASFGVATGTGIQAEPGVDMDPSGSFIVAWEDDASGSREIYAQRYNSSGTSLGSAFQANTYITNTQSDAEVALDNNGGSVVAWESFGQDTSNDGVFAQRFTNLSTTWYFAEGYTGDGFEEWLTLQNPNPIAAAVTVTYTFRGGATTITKNKTVAANSRETISVNSDVGDDREVSIKVDSDQPIIAERPMYFNYQNKWQGGHNTIGATSTSNTWYFAEGYTGEGFEEWLTLQNPTGTDATVTIVYFYRGGTAQLIKTKTVPANSRETISVNEDAGENQEVSIYIFSTQPLVAERPIYFSYQFVSPTFPAIAEGGHNTIGATSPSSNWYFAEGYTGFEQWLTLQNSNVAAATATITYYFRDGGTPSTTTLNIPANSRETVNVNSDVGDGREVSIKVQSTQAIIAERPIYFFVEEAWDGGHNTIGIETPVNQWFFAEGYTGSGFDEWLTLQNPNAINATATITYTFRGGAAPMTRTITIPANSRETVEVNADVGANKEVSIKVDSDQPIIAERPMYFNYQDKWTGGHNTIGFGP